MATVSSNSPRHKHSPEGHSQSSRNRETRSLRGHCTSYTKDGRCLECSYGYYGKDCKRPCSHRCIYACDKETGHCQNCNASFFGPDCQNKCSAHCTDGECNVKSGHCLNGCRDNHWGTFCENDCGSCRNSSCFYEDGSCLLGCNDGFFGSNCNQSCPYQCPRCCQGNGTCVECFKGFCGQYCNESCSVQSTNVTAITVTIAVIVFIACIACVVYFKIPKRSWSSLKGCSPGRNKGPKLRGCSDNTPEAVSLR